MAKTTNKEPKKDAVGAKQSAAVAQWKYSVSDGEVTILGVKRWLRAKGDLEIPATMDDCPVLRIGEKAFEECSKLTSVTIPSSVTSIGKYAFSYCSGLTSVAMPDSVMSIGESAFYGCTSLTGVYITDLEKWCGISFPDPSSNPLRYAHNLYLNGTLVRELTIPGSVSHIGDRAFGYCESLTSVTIGNGVKSFGWGTFNDCKVLASVTIPGSVTSIAYSAFQGCSGLTSVTIPDGVTSIEDHAFEGCSGLKSVTIPNSVTSIGEFAFYDCSDSLFGTNKIPGVKLVDGCVVDYE